MPLAAFRMQPHACWLVRNTRLCLCFPRKQAHLLFGVEALFRSDRPVALREGPSQKRLQICMTPCAVLAGPVNRKESQP